MTCREFADFMMDYSSGELAAPRRAAFDRHMGRCANCREYLALYERAVALGRRVFRDDEADARAEGIPDALVAAILAARQE